MKSDPRLKQYARELRRELSPAERRVWKLLRDRRLQGFKFRRQHPVGPYIADFCCLEAMLVLELDGESHLTRKSGDVTRDRFFTQKGFHVLRVWNTDLYENSNGLFDRIWSLCRRRTLGLAGEKAPSAPRRTDERAASAKTRRPPKEATQKSPPAKANAAPLAGAAPSPVSIAPRSSHPLPKGRGVRP